MPNTDSDSESSSNASSDNEEDSELKQLAESIKTTVTCLLRFSMTIQAPAPENRIQKAIAIDTSFYEEYDVLHVREKYPDCANYLSERLGRAISARRHYLSYRDQHHQKLSKNVELVGIEEARSEHTNNSTQATSLPETPKDTGDVLDDDGAMSQTSYASSVNAAIRVPPLPSIALEQEHYECPLCFRIVCIHVEAAWKYASILYQSSDANDIGNTSTEIFIRILVHSSSVQQLTVFTIRVMHGFSTS
jgi:hypothetical protein